MEKGRAVEGGVRIRRHGLVRRASVLQWRASRWHPVIRALLWTIAAGFLFQTLNSVMRVLALQTSPGTTQLMRYVGGIVAMLPFVWRAGWAAYMPLSIRGQFVRGGVHTVGLTMWFIAVPHVALADITAIGFTGPIFIMIGAAMFFGEKMRWERWVAAAIGFVGVLIVVAPKLTASGGGYSLVLLAASPVFAASFLITKSLTRYEKPEVIVLWQNIAILLLSIPVAMLDWKQPVAWHWLAFLWCGVMGTLGNYCLARSFVAADISATQSVKFLDLVWASLLGWIIFADLPTESTLIGGAVICLSTVWIARREARGLRRCGCR